VKPVTRVRRKNKKKGFALIIALGLGLAALAYVLSSVRFKDAFIFLSVEESSSNALSVWPPGYEKMPQAIIDPSEKSLLLPKKKSLFGVRLCIYYSVFSQGIQISDDLRFWRLGRGAVRLSKPVLLPVIDLRGETIQAVDNEARVVGGDLEVTETSPEGKVTLKYGGRSIVLHPGETFNQLLVKTPEGVKEVRVPEAAEAIERYLEKGYPLTRLTVTNWGLWPKTNVQVAMGR